MELWDPEMCPSAYWRVFSCYLWSFVLQFLSHGHSETVVMETIEKQ